jgi:hypothetical protein
MMPLLTVKGTLAPFRGQMLEREITVIVHKVLRLRGAFIFGIACYVKSINFNLKESNVETVLPNRQSISRFVRVALLAIITVVTMGGA